MNPTMKDEAFGVILVDDEGDEIDITHLRHMPCAGVKPSDVPSHYLVPVEEWERKGHCKDCCCAQIWQALGITEFTGKHLVEHIGDLKVKAAKWDRLTRAPSRSEQRRLIFQMIEEPAP